MKVVTLLGSPRAKGNSTTLAKTFNTAAEALGADVKTFLLNKLDARGCQACDSCKTKTDRCVLKDELAEVLEAVAQTDVLVMATPIYFADISAQMKLFVDRCYSYLKPYETVPEATRLPAGKKIVLITTQNRTEEMFAEVCKKYLMIFKFLGFTESHLIRGCDLNKADALKTKNRQDLFDMAKKTAQAAIQ